MFCKTKKIKSIPTPRPRMCQSLTQTPNVPKSPNQQAQAALCNHPHPYPHSHHADPHPQSPSTSPFPTGHERDLRPSAPERACASAAGRRQVGPTRFDVQNMCAPQRFEPATLSLGRLMSGAADQLLQLSVLLNLEL